MNVAETIARLQQFPGHYIVTISSSRESSPAVHEYALYIKEKEMHHLTTNIHDASDCPRKSNGHECLTTSKFVNISSLEEELR